MEPKAYMIVSVTKRCIGIDLSFHTEEEARAELNSDFYTDRKRKIRQVVPYYNENGKEYIRLNGKFVRLDV